VAALAQQQKNIKNSELHATVLAEVFIMSKIVNAGKNQTSKKTRSQELLNTVPDEKGFHFFTEYGKYTGVTATSVVEFGEKLQTIPVESITFHFQRDDFQKWLRNVIGDEELAQRFDRVKEWPSWSSDENLRKELLKTVQMRIVELGEHP
jgi:hypothetical protein